MPLFYHLLLGITSWSDLLRQLFTLNPTEPFKTSAKVVTIGAALFGIATTVITKTIPWLHTKLDSRNVAKNLGPEFPRASISRAIRYYIRPFCQDLDPAGSEEPRLVFGVQQKLFEALDRALTHPTEYNFIILLADSGMGKTSALMNYYARHLRRWRKPFELQMIPLGIPNADERIASIKERKNVVLFLDALDEDTLAIVDHVQRLRDLLKLTSDFDRVVISCRTQFFSKDEEIPKETGKIRVGVRAAGESAEYLFHKIYLSPFSDEQVYAYLKERYPIWHLKSRRKARAMVEKIPHLTARPMLLAHIDDLVVANRQIQYSYELYEEMVEAWLKREQGFIKETDDLRQFSERLAVNIFVNRAERGSERITKSDLVKLSNEWRISLDDWKLSGRSLLNRDAAGNFKFAHRTIMEYLFVKRFLSSDKNCLTVPWTDQMIDFYLEVAAHRRSRGERAFQERELAEAHTLGEQELAFLQTIVEGTLKRAVESLSKRNNIFLLLLLENTFHFLGLPFNGLVHVTLNNPSVVYEEQSFIQISVREGLNLESVGQEFVEVSDTRFRQLITGNHFRLRDRLFLNFEIAGQTAAVVAIWTQESPLIADTLLANWRRITAPTRVRHHEELASIRTDARVNTILAPMRDTFRRVHEPQLGDILWSLTEYVKRSGRPAPQDLNSLLFSEPAMSADVSVLDIMREASEHARQMNSGVVTLPHLLSAIAKLSPSSTDFIRVIKSLQHLFAAEDDSED